MPKDSKDYLGTLVGGSVSATGAFPLIRAIQDAKALNKLPPTTFASTINPKDLKAGDILLSSSVEDVNAFDTFDHLKQLVQRGRRDLGHAAIVMPADNRFPVDDLRVVELGAIKTRKPTAKYRSFDKLRRGVAQKKSVKQILRSILLNKAIGKSALEGKTLSDAQLRNIISESMHVSQDLIDDFTEAVHVYRPKEPLYSSEITKMWDNLRRTAPFTASQTSQAGTGARSFLNPIRDKMHKLKIPGTCAGGVCNIYSGIRKTMSPSSALVTDIPLMKDFKRVASYSTLPKKLDYALVNRALAKKAIGVKGALAAALISAGFGTKALIDKARK